MRIRELAEGRWRREFGAKPEMDPLTEEDALMEAQILQVAHDVLRGRAAILFELRLAMQLREGNAGLLIGEGVTVLEWRAASRGAMRTAWTVVGSIPKVESGLVELELNVLPEAELVLRASGAAFYSGNVPGMLKVPDYGTVSDSELRSMTAGWDSEFLPLHAVFLDPGVGG